MRQEIENASALRAELDWEERRRGAARRTGTPVDCDLSCVVCGRDGRYLQGVSAQVPVYGQGAIRHHGDALRGGGKGERIDLDLTALPERVGKVAILLNVYALSGGARELGALAAGTVRLTCSGETVFSLELAGRFAGAQGVIVGELIREGAVWRFQPVARPVENAPASHSLFHLYS